MEYIENINDLNINLEATEPGIIVIALDESGSMSGKPWKNAVNGAKKLIKYMKQYHQSHQNVQIVILLFGSEVREAYNKPLSDQMAMEEIFKFGGDFNLFSKTQFGAPILMGMNKIDEYIENK